MVELKIGNGVLNNVIYAGKVRTYKDGLQVWSGDKVDVTDDAVACVIRHIHRKEKENGGYYYLPIDGKLYELRLVEVIQDGPKPKEEGQ
ncbi:MAG: hypothetical protein IJT54_05980 [Candidatus Methanomethylophilaceae archaeon]|nr:hypothetical protein [Candidatus Methanomethylophilaceae archaeon]